MKVLSCFLFIIFASSTFAAEFKLDKLTFSTGFNLQGVEAKDQKARVLGLDLNVSLADKMGDDFLYFLDITASFQRGSSEVLGIVSEFEPVDEINLNSGGFKYTPTSFLEFKVGALDQGEHASPLLIGNTAFAAVQGKVSFWKLYLQALQAIPSNNKLSKRLGDIDDATPSFSMETLGLRLGGKRTRFKAEASHFQFKNLSSNIALASQEFGNSTNSKVGDAADFLYGFNGVNGTLYFEHLFMFGLRVVTSGQYLFNSDAPDEKGQGNLVKLGLGGKSWLIFGESFFNESDSSPGFYNSKYYGHNNVEGFSTGVEMKGEDYSFEMRYAQAKIIKNIGILQDDMQILTINWVKRYDF